MFETRQALKGVGWIIGCVLSVCLHTSMAVAQCVPPPSGLLAWWDADSVTGTTAFDIQDANDGTLVNGASTVPGFVGQAFSFDGVDDFVTFGTSVGNFGTGDFTIDFWIRTSSTRKEGILGKRPICGHSSFWDIRLRADGRLAIELDQDAAATNYNPVATTSAVNDGIFHHVTVVRQGTTMSVYIDGVLDATGMTSGVTNIVNSAALNAGKSTCTAVDETKFFTGLLDEVEIFNRALSASEIQAIYNAGSAGKCKFPNTPTGTDVTVNLTACNSTMTYDTVTEAGNTDCIKRSTGPSPPSGFKIALFPGYYDLSTSASFIGKASVCFEYDESQVQGPESNLRLKEFNNGWTDITILPVDTVRNRICGETNHFSFFAIMEADSDGDGVVDSLDACLNSDLGPTILIGGVDTGVENEIVGDGCTLSDLIAELLAEDPSTDVIVQFLVDLKGEGAITGQEMGAMLRALNSP